MLGSEAVAVYHAVVEDPGVSTAELAERLALDLGVVAGQLEVLARAGLLAAGGTPEVVAQAVSPRVGLALLAERTAWEARHHLAEMEQANAEIGRLLARLAEGPRDALSEYADAGQAVVRVVHAVRRAQHGIVLLLGAEGGGLLGQGVAAAIQTAVGGGALLRMVTDGAAREGDIRPLRVLVEMGGPGQWRRARGVPTSLLLVDGVHGLLLPSCPGSPAIWVGHPALAAALGSLFDAIWESAVEVAGTLVSEDAAGSLAGVPSHVRLARVLARGVKDDTAARLLGVSTRSVSRLVAELCEELGARTRFQAGVEVARRGWL